MTDKGHISKNNKCDGYARVQGKGKNSIEYIFIKLGKMYRVVFRSSLSTDQETYTGLDALIELRSNCKEDLEEFIMTDNKEIEIFKNKKIPVPLNELTPIGMAYKVEKGKVPKEDENIIYDAFHIDINSAYPAGVVATYPEKKQLVKFFNKHFNLRHEAPIHKAVMNYAIGVTQSLKFLGPRYPELARAGIQWTVNKLLELTKKLEKKGYRVLGYNTDGIFVQKGYPEQPVYKDSEEGTGLGQWKISHIFDKLRFKSEGAGSYEFIENGIYEPRVKGQTKLDELKPRSE